MADFDISELLPQQYEFVPARTEEGKHPTRRGNAKGSKYMQDEDTSDKRKVGNNDDFDLPKYELVPADFVAQTLRKLEQSRMNMNRSVGFTNMGNTCFLNSTLQVLMHSQPFAAMLLTGNHHVNCQAVGFCSLCSLTKIAMQYFKGGNRKKPIVPIDIVRNIRSLSRTFVKHRQEDSHEFLVFLLDNIQKMLVHGYPHLKKDARSLETSAMYRVFGGYIRRQVKCVANHDSNSYDSFQTLSLELTAQVRTVKDALKMFTRKETLQGANAYKCEACNKKVRATTQLLLYRPPVCLALQLKRFQYAGFHRHKQTQHIAFPASVDLSSVIANPKRFKSTKYSLYGVLVHLGHTPNSGHYFSFIKTPSGTWYRVDDSSASVASLKTVLAQRAYMLFYSKTALEPVVAATAASVRNNLHSINTDFQKQAKTYPLPQGVYGPERPSWIPRKVTGDDGDEKEDEKNSPLASPESSPLKPPGRSPHPLESTPKAHAKPVSSDKQQLALPRRMLGFGFGSKIRFSWRGKHLPPPNVAEQKPNVFSFSTIPSVVKKKADVKIDKLFQEAKEQNVIGKERAVKLFLNRASTDSLFGKHRVDSWDTTASARRERKAADTQLAASMQDEEDGVGRKRERDAWDIDYDQGKAKKRKENTPMKDFDHLKETQPFQNFHKTHDLKPTKGSTFKKRSQVKTKNPFAKSNSKKGFQKKGFQKKGFQKKRR